MRPVGPLMLPVLALAATVAGPAEEISFRRDVLPVLDVQCVMCHVPGAALGGLSLYPDAWKSLVGAASAQSPLKLVEPNAPDSSYLYLKLTGTQDKAGGSGQPMPPTGALDAATIDLVRRWIEQGAPEN